MRELGFGRDKDDESERRLQREVLAYALVEHPLAMTVAELERHLGRGQPVAEAVAALVADGLLALRDEEVLPTPAALLFNRIEPIDPPSGP